jgi:AcrR family transcriptional regulator
MSRREMYKERTRFDLAVAAFELAKADGLAAVRVPEIATRADVSTRTFNNYFASKEEAIAWLAGQHAAGLAPTLLDRPADEPLATALTEAVLSRYHGPDESSGLPAGWLNDFRAMVAREPALHGEYLRATSAAEQDLAEAVRQRAGVDALAAGVIAGVVTGAERAAVRHWMADRAGKLTDVVRTALELALNGVSG